MWVSVAEYNINYLYRCKVTDSAGNVVYSKPAAVKTGQVTWKNTYNADGLRTKRTDGYNTYTYYYTGDKLTYMTVGDDVLRFSYSASGTPLTVQLNSTRYFYITNQQGDVEAIVSVGGYVKVKYAYDAWGNIISVTGSMADTLGKINPLRYRGYIYDTETELYYLQSRYYDPQVGRFLNADALVATGQGLVGNNMFVYCLNNPISFVDSSGTCSYNKITGEWCDCGRGDCPSSASFLPFTASMGVALGLGIGPLAMSVQFSIVTDAYGASELQISYSVPSIFSTGLPSVEEMLADISSDTPKFKFGFSFAGSMTFTNAPRVEKLRGPTYSTGISGPGVAIEYNAIPDPDTGKAYSGITVSGGMITPGVNVTMSNTATLFSVPFSVFDLAEAARNGLWGGH